VIQLQIAVTVMKTNRSTKIARRFGITPASSIACLAFVLMGLPGSVLAKEPAAAVAQPDTATQESAETEEHPRLAPQVDLGEPVEQSLPLQIVEPASDDAVVETAIEPVAEPARAESVDLGEPIIESPPQPVEETTVVVAPDAAEQAVSKAPGAELEQQPAETAENSSERGDDAVSPALEPATVAAESTPDPAVPVAPEVVAAAPLPAVAKPEPRLVPAFVMLGAEVAPGTSTRLSWSPSHSFEGIAAPTPVLVVNGAKQGPVLCLTAAVHGDELNGIEIVRRVLYNLNAQKLSGTVIGVPIVNLQGFRRGSRYLPDRRDLNRFFPGDPRGSSAARIAHSFFHEVIGHCDALVDLHTGSFYRTNLPQLRADLRDSDVLELSQGFDGTVVLQSEGALGTLRQAAVAAGIPAVTLEAGEPMRLQEKEVNHGVKSVQSLLGKMGMIKKSSFWGEPEPVYYQSAWVRADQGGILFSEVDLGERVKENEVLGTVTDPITNVRTEIVSPYRGRVLGMALNQVVMPGFAAFRIGIPTEADVIDTSDPDAQLPSTLHTSQVEKDRPKPTPMPASKPVAELDDFEGLEDSE
jgi:predicted deacylase